MVLSRLALTMEAERALLPMETIILRGSGYDGFTDVPMDASGPRPPKRSEVSNHNERTWGFFNMSTSARSLFGRPGGSSGIGPIRGSGLGPPSTWCGNCATSPEERAMNRYIALEEGADWNEFAVDLGWMFEGAEGISSAEGEVVMIDRSGDSDQSNADSVPYRPEIPDAYNDNWDNRGRV